MTPDFCPNCGAELPPKARVCPECGSDEETGWSEEARYDGLDLPDEDFDYEHFMKREYGRRKPNSTHLNWLWWAIAVLILLGFAFLFFRTVLQHPAH